MSRRPSTASSIASACTRPPTRHRRQVVELDAVADGGRARRELAGDRLHRRLLGEADHAGRGEHRDVAGARARSRCRSSRRRVTRRRRVRVAAARTSLFRVAGHIPDAHPVVGSRRDRTRRPRTHPRHGPRAAAATSPRCSPRTGASSAPASTTAASRSWCRAASAAPGSASCGATRPASRTPPICREPGLARGGRRPRPRPHAAATASTRVVALERRATDPPHEVARAARDGRQGAQGRRCSSGPTPRPARVGDSIRQVSASYADVAAPDPRRQLRRRCSPRTTRSAPASWCSASRSATPGCRPAWRRPGRTVGFELFDEIDAGGGRPHRGRPGAHDAPRPARHRRASCRSCCKRGAGGVLFHEACGHGLEADLVGRDASVFRGQRRRAGRVAARHRWSTTARIAREWGTYAIDDEGTPAQRNVLIEDGVLTDYMWDLVRARKEGRASSGNGRRETYQHLPMVRMTNTYLLDGRRRPRRHHPPTPSTASTASRSAAVRSTPRPATSCSASPRRT